MIVSSTTIFGGMKPAGCFTQKLLSHDFYYEYYSQPLLLPLLLLLYCYYYFIATTTTTSTTAVSLYGQDVMYLMFGSGRVRILYKAHRGGDRDDTSWKTYCIAWLGMLDKKQYVAIGGTMESHAFGRSSVCHSSEIEHIRNRPI